MNSLANISGIQELDVHEKYEINGGEALWYHLGYYLGKGFRFVEGALENPPNPQSATTYK